MSIKNYFINNKKKVSIISSVSILLIVMLFGFIYMRFYANAGVFKKNSKNDSYDYKTNVNVLEIVAQYGQQVLGYTVSGSEPITKDQIENYHGDIDVDDFKNATGYVLNKSDNGDSTYNYKVQSSELKDTFNSNVLDDAMDLSENSKESITVNVCQANELTDDIINSADLVFINSHDYNENLLYYYDQIVNDGSNEIKQGDYGRNYTDSYQKEELKTVVALANMKKAAGNSEIAGALTKESFDILNLINYKEYNYDQYIEAFGKADKKSFEADSEEETIDLINDLLSKVNEDESKKAAELISSSANKASFTDEEKESLTIALEKLSSTNYMKVNNDKYIQQISNTYMFDGIEKIQTMITNVNTFESTNAINELIKIKTTNDTTTDPDSIKVLFQKLAYSAENEGVLNEYVEGLKDIEFTFSAPTNQATSLDELKGMIDKVNAKKQKDVLETIANAPISEEQMNLVSENALAYFDIVSKEYGQPCSNVSKYNIEKYVLALKKLSESEESSNSLLKSDIASTTDYHYDLEKISSFIDEVNKENGNVNVDTTYDMTWHSAMTLYDHVILDDNGLMYNTQLLTDKTKGIGDFTTDSITNNNNIYKLLLVTRQLRDNYFKDQYASKVDSNGVYYPEGLDEDEAGIGTGIDSWWKETFGNDFTDYKKYREPEVVGKTYTEDGVEGNSVNYVYKHIYSFTGEQFFGGDKFVNSIKVGDSLTGLVSNSVDITDRYIYLDLSEASTWLDNKNAPFAYFWSNDGKKTTTIQMKLQDESHLQYRVIVPEGVNNVVFKPYSGSNWDRQTEDLSLGDGFKDRVYSIKEKYSYRRGYYTYSTNVNNKTVIDGYMTNSIQNNEVEYYNSLDVTFTGCNVTNARYRINDGKWETLTLNQTIKIGDGVGLDQSTKLEIQYDTFSTFASGGGESKVYHYKKVDDHSKSGANYLMNTTATNNDNIQKSVTQDADLNNLLDNATKGTIVRYISGFTLNVLTDMPFKVLEIEPSANCTNYNSYEGAVKLAKMLKVNVKDMNKSNWKDYFEITPLGIREFDTRNYDYLADFDLIYIGSNVKNQRIDSNGRTLYKDSNMNGYVYTGIGDVYTVKPYFAGTAASDYTEAYDSYSWNASHKLTNIYWKNYAFDQFTGNESIGHSEWNLSKDKDYYFIGNNASARMLGTDITVKKMEQLLEYVKAGAPIMINDKILNADGSSGEKSYVDPNSKMYNFIKDIKALGLDTTTNTYTGLNDEGNQTFSDGGICANIVAESTAETGKNASNMDTNNKFKGGLSYAVKRNFKVEFELQDSPQEYTKNKDGSPIVSGNVGTYITYSDSDFKTYNYVLKVNTNVDMSWVKENYDFQVYVDKSGTGKFEDSVTIAIDPTIVFNNDDNTISLKGSWPGNMEGFVPWKVVATSKNNTNNYYAEIGYSAFKNPNPKDVYVLWVKPDDGVSLNMNFQTMVDNNKSLIEDYIIHVKNIKYKDFVNKWKDYTVMDYSDDISKLKIKDYFGTEYKGDPNDQLNMLVFGFCDSYQGLDINNVSALRNIQYFLDSGHSLLFSHDNSSTFSTFNYYKSGNTQINKDYDFGTYTTTMLRQMLGMDVFGATYSGNAFNPESSQFNEAVYNSRLYLDDSLTPEDFRGIGEMNMFRYNVSSPNQFYTDDSNNVQNICANTGLATTNSVRRMNEGQITDYPFIIGNTLDIATTHSQYLGLNQEDKDLTVWYTLDKQKNGDNNLYKYANGDGSNNYYIYSKGNITYTGAGHAKDDSKTLEQKLFVNTVIAAIKLGSLKPDVSFPDAKINSTGKNVVYKYDSDSGLNVSFKATDYDSKKGAYPFVQCDVFIDVNADGVYSPDQDIMLNDPSNSYLSEITDEDDGVYSNLSADMLSNRKVYSFVIPDNKITQITSDPKMTNNGKTIYDVPIVVKVTKTSEKDPSKLISSYNSIYVESREIFNLR